MGTCTSLYVAREGGCEEREYSSRWRRCEFCGNGCVMYANVNVHEQRAGVDTCMERI